MNSSPDEQILKESVLMSKVLLIEDFHRLVVMVGAYRDVPAGTPALVVDDLRIRIVDDPPALQEGSVTKVQIFSIQEESLIQKTYFSQESMSKHQK